MSKKYYKIHIFAPGTHRSASGHKVTISDGDLRNTANTFISNHRVPLCLGHSSFKHQDIVPSLGWFRDVKQDADGNLFGLVEPTTAGKNLLEGGYYENFSASFYAPDSPLNPKPGTWTLRHVAALGGEPPALKELDPMLEVLPEDFAEVQNFDTWYEFKEVDSNEFESFNDGTTKILPDNYDFKSYRTFGGKLRCKTGQKQCGGRCIPNNWKCKVGQSKKFTPGSRTEYKKPKLDTAPSKPIDKGAGEKQEKKWLSKEDYKKQKQEENQKGKDKKTAKSTIKGLAALGVTMAVTIGTEKAFPNNKNAKDVAEILGNVAANQFLLEDSATLKDRITAGTYAALEGTLGKTVERQLEGNYYAKTMSKATTGMLSTILLDSGMININYDGYAKKMYNAADTLQSAIKDAQSWKKAENQKDSLIDQLNKKGDEVSQRIKKDAQDADTVRDREIREAMAEIKRDARTAQEAASRASASNKEAQKALLDLIDRLLNKGDIDYEGYIEQLNALRESIQNKNPNFSDYSVNSNKPITYANNQTIPITFSSAQVAAAVLPILIALMAHKGSITKSDYTKLNARTITSGNPRLDAIFSELGESKGVLKHDVSNSELHEALFGTKRISDDFSEEGTAEDKRRRRKRRKKLEPVQNYQEEPQKKPKKLKIDVLIDDALKSAEELDFSERRRRVKKSQNKNRRANPPNANFKERKRKRRNTHNAMDFKESEEYRTLSMELERAKRQTRHVEMENFAEGLYREGRLTEGIVKKRDLIDLMMGLEDSRDSFSFAEGDTDPKDILLKILNNTDPLVSFSEVVTETDLIPQPVFEDGYDLESQKMDHQINLLLQANPSLTYEQAWAKIAGRALR